MQPEPVVVRAPLAAVRQLLQPSGLSLIVPGLRADGGSTTVLRLWHRGEVEQLEVALDSLPDGAGSLLRSVGAPGPQFRVSLRAVPDDRRPSDVSDPARCRLAAEVEVSADPADGPPRAAWLRHALPLLAAEVAGLAEDVTACEQGSSAPEAATADAPAPPVDLPAPGGRDRVGAVGRVGRGVPAAVTAAGVLLAVVVVLRRWTTRDRGTRP